MPVNQIRALGQSTPWRCQPHDKPASRGLDHPGSEDGVPPATLSLRTVPHQHSPVLATSIAGRETTVCMMRAPGARSWTSWPLQIPQVAVCDSVQ
jgi:hypothetical protein